MPSSQIESAADAAPEDDCHRCGSAPESTRSSSTRPASTSASAQASSPSSAARLTSRSYCLFGNLAPIAGKAVSAKRSNDTAPATCERSRVNPGSAFRATA